MIPISPYEECIEILYLPDSHEIAVIVHEQGTPEGGECVYSYIIQEP